MHKKLIFIIFEISYYSSNRFLLFQMFKYIIISASVICVIGVIKYISIPNHLQLMFEKIKKLIVKDKIYYPRINEIKFNSQYNLHDCTNLAIDKKIKEVKNKIRDCSRFDYERLLLLEKNFFEEFKIMKIIYDNFYQDDILKSNSKILFYDSEWYEISHNIKYLAIINNDNINLDNLENGIEELTIFRLNKPILNLPSTLKKIHLYNIDVVFDIKKLKIPVNCELYIESCIIHKDKFL